LVLGTKPVAHTSHKHRYVCALAPTIGMKLVYHDEFEPVRVRDDGAIKRALARH
jgi:hypothetical protein